MKEPPGQTFAHMLGELLGLAGQFIGCLEWQTAAPPEAMTRTPTLRTILAREWLCGMGAVRPRSDSPWFRPSWPWTG